ncbi:MAG: DUF433 domain-containing protein [Chloroflexi bacterium]|nr:DUF433 domain-containing protein [Chloroflexota bacterium]
MYDTQTWDSQPALDTFRTGKAYTAARAARLAGTTAATVRRWLFGYEAPGHQMAPVFGAGRATGEDGPLVVSFLELVEIAVVARFRSAESRHGRVSLERLRRAHNFARERLGLPYPFATLNLFEFGGHLLHEFDTQYPGPGILALDLQGQWALPGLVRDEMAHLDFGARDPFAVRWFPKGRNVPIVIDPHIAAGRPTILDSGVTLETLSRRWHGGESIKDLVLDYELVPRVVEEALKYVA